jgi:hypothetical protein
LAGDEDDENYSDLVVSEKESSHEKDEDYSAENKKVFKKRRPTKKTEFDLGPTKTKRANKPTAQPAQ